MRTATSYTKEKIDELFTNLTGSGITRAEMDEAIAGVVGASPAQLDTLNELAVALSNDPNFVNTINAALADRVKGTVRLTVASMAPTTPEVNDLWLDTTN